MGQTKIKITCVYQNQPCQVFYISSESYGPSKFGGLYMTVCQWDY